MANVVSIREATTGVLLAYGTVSRSNPGELIQAEADGFALTPGLWQWNGSAWVPVTPGTTPRADALTKLNAVAADATVPGSVKAALAAIAKVL